METIFKKGILCIDIAYIKGTSLTEVVNKLYYYWGQVRTLWFQCPKMRLTL